MHAPRITVLIAATISAASQAAIDPQLVEKHLQSRATDVAHIIAQNVHVQEGSEVNKVQARALVVRVISSQAGLTVGQTITIRYDQNHAWVRREIAERERKAQEGWVGGQVIGYPPTLQTGETVEAHLRTRNREGDVFYPAAKEASFQRISSHASNPCAAMEEVGPITTLVRECARTSLEVAQKKLGEILHTMRQQLQSATSGDEKNLRDAANTREDAFRNSQNHWERYRWAACEEVYYAFWPGSMAASEQLRCLLDLTANRVKHLRQREGHEDDGRG